MLPRKPLLVLLLMLLGAGLGPAHAERGSRSAAEHSTERAAAREQRDRLRSERAARERERKASRDSRTREVRTTTAGSSTDGTEARLDTSNSGSDSSSSGSGSSGSNISGSGTSGSSGSGSSGSGSGGSDSSGPGSAEDRSGRSGSDDDNTARMMSGRGTPIAIERDTRGRERRAGEVLVVSATSAAPQARAAGYEVIEERALAAFDEILVRVRIPAGQDLEATLSALRTLLPAATVAANHVFLPSNSEIHATLAVTPGPSISGTARIGIIDTGAFDGSPALQGMIEQVGAFGGSPYTPREHGTVVCEIATTRGARLSVADVFGVDADSRLIATADAIASALNWLVGTKAPVINISVAGPYNPILEHIIARTIAGGALIVAAAGNEGPAADPVYPAAYAGVVAVTAVDERGQVYRRANRGDYVMFAARGVHVPVRGSSQPLEVSGTSFAAPVVAAELARRQTLEPGAAPAALLEELKHDVTDLGARGRDPVYGWGRIGEVQLHEQP